MSQLSLEAQLVLCCARTRLDSARDARLRSLLTQSPDATRTLSLAGSHGLLPLLATHLLALGEAWPEAWVEPLRAGLREAQARSLQLTGVLLQLAGRFSAAGIPAATYKGPALAQVLYGNVALRPFGDLDFLLAHADAPRAGDLLVREGYLTDAQAFAEGRADVAGQFLFHDAQRQVLIELHTERTLRHFPRPVTAAWLLEGAQPVAIQGREVPTLPPARLLIALAVHGTKDYWEQWKWICDIAEFLRVHASLDWPAAYEEARRFGCERMLSLALSLAAQMFDAPLPEAVRVRLRADPEADRLAAFLLKRMHSGTAAFSAFERFRFRARTCDGPWEGLRYALRLATTPAQEDWESARLPRALYPLVRPFRLFRKYRS